MGWKRVGARVQAAVDRILESFPEIERMVEALRNGQQVEGMVYETREQAREHILEELGIKNYQSTPGGVDIELIKALGRAAGDEDASTHIPVWLDEDLGASLGFDNDIPVCGVFPTVVEDNPSQESLPSLVTDTQGWTNYKSVEEDLVHALELAEKAEQNGYCRILDSESECHDMVGTRDLTVQPLGMVSREKEDGTIKRRLVFDYLRSGTNARIRLSERIVLPRLSDAVDNAKRVHRHLQPNIILEWLVLDFSDAFHHVKLGKKWWRHNVCKIGPKWIVYTALSFGARSFPNLWGRVAAFIGRLTASCLQYQHADIQIFVDDPLVSASGSTAARNRVFASVFTIFAVLNFKVAWSKAVLARDVTWIGGQLSSTPTSITVAIPPGRRDKFLAETISILSAGAIQARRLRSYTGLASFYAGFIPWFKPYITVLWGALTDVGRLHTPAKRMKIATGVAASLIPVRRIKHAMLWLRAFLMNWDVCSRSFAFDSLEPAADSYIATDASPWGMGGILVAKGVITEFFSVQISHEDVTRFRAKVGESSFITLWESLALLIAARLWLQPHSVLYVKADSLGALRMAMKMSSKSASMNRIAMELSLHMCLNEFEIGFMRHIPGVSNETPDALSRQFGPSVKPFPTMVGNALRRTVPVRNAEYWRAS
jgi:hypothetical protein